MSQVHSHGIQARHFRAPGAPCPLCGLHSGQNQLRISRLSASPKLSQSCEVWQMEVCPSGRREARVYTRLCTKLT